MKGIVLRDYEVRRLASAGSVLIWRRVKDPKCPPWRLRHLEGGSDKREWTPTLLESGQWAWVFHGEIECLFKCPHGSTGETRFVKEKWRSWDEEQRIIYKADYQPIEMKMRWKSEVSMPSEASRFRVTLSVSCRRIQSVNNPEAENSGVSETPFWTPREVDENPKPIHEWKEPYWDDHYFFSHYHRFAFRKLIESSHPGSWKRQDWFWAIEAKEVK